MPRDEEAEQIRAIMEQVEGKEPPLHVEVKGDNIVVTMSGTDFYVAYQKPQDKPHLVLTQCRLPLITTQGVSRFRARAFQGAVDKARELGWIA